MASRSKTQNRSAPLFALRASLCFSLAIVSAVASAQLYKWTDENGKTHYSDSIPPSANDRARKEIRPDGVVKKQIDRALTPDEHRANAARAADEQKERVAREEKDRREKALLTSFASLEEYDRVRARDLAALQSENTALENRIYTLQTQRSELAKSAPKNNAEKLTREKQNADISKQIENVTRDRDLSVKSIVEAKERFKTERELFAKLFNDQAAANKTGAVANPANPSNAAAQAAKKK